MSWKDYSGEEHGYRELIKKHHPDAKVGRGHAEGVTQHTVGVRDTVVGHYDSKHKTGKVKVHEGSIMKKFGDIVSELAEAKVDKEGFPEVHADHEALKSKSTAEIHKQHQGTLGPVRGKYSAAEVGGKRGMIGDILRSKHGVKKVKGYFKLDEEALDEATTDHHAEAVKVVKPHAHDLGATDHTHEEDGHVGHMGAVHPSKMKHLHTALTDAGFKLKSKKAHPPMGGSHSRDSEDYHHYQKGKTSVHVASGSNTYGENGSSHFDHHHVEVTTSK